MKRLLPLILLLAPLAVSACATAPDGLSPAAQSPTSALERQFAWSGLAGDNAIRGAVAYRTPAGGAFSCAGRSVALTPAAPISAIRTERLYGSTDHAVSSLEAVRQRSAGQSAPAYARWMRSTQCDEQGRFAFEGLPDGGWFLIATAKPERAGAQPVVIMRRIEARGGQTRMLDLR